VLENTETQMAEPVPHAYRNSKRRMGKKDEDAEPPPKKGLRLEEVEAGPVEGPTSPPSVFPTLVAAPASPKANRGGGGGGGGGGSGGGGGGGLPRGALTPYFEGLVRGFTQLDRALLGGGAYGPAGFMALDVALRGLAPTLSRDDVLGMLGVLPDAFVLGWTRPGAGPSPVLTIGLPYGKQGGASKVLQRRAQAGGMAPLPPLDYLTDRTTTFKAACVAHLSHAHDEFLDQTGTPRPRGGRWHESFVPDTVRPPVGSLPPGNPEPGHSSSPAGARRAPSTALHGPTTTSMAAGVTGRQSSGQAASHPSEPATGAQLRQQASRLLETRDPAVGLMVATLPLPLPHRVAFLLKVACELDVALRTRRTSGPKPWSDVRRALQATLGNDIDDQALSQVGTESSDPLLPLHEGVALLCPGQRWAVMKRASFYDDLAPWGFALWESARTCACASRAHLSTCTRFLNCCRCWACFLTRSPSPSSAFRLLVCLGPRPWY
jgi:hypothetical protein